MQPWKSGALAAVLALAACGGDRSGDTAAAAPGVDVQGKVLRVGELNDLSGPVAAIGRPWSVGRRMLAVQIKAGNSGLLPAGWTIELVERDHGYNPQRSVQLFNEIKDQVLWIGTSFGTPNTLPLRPLLQRANIVAFPASLSSKMAEFRYTPPPGPSYKIEAMRAMDFAVAQAGDPGKVRAGILYQQDDYGQDGLEGWTAAAAHYGVELVAQQTYAPGQPDYTAAVTALKVAGATHVLLTTVPSATGPVLGTAAQLDYRPVWIGNSPSWIDRFFDPAVLPPQILENYHWVNGFAYWGEDVPFFHDFLKVYEQYGRALAEPDYYILASYAIGLVEVETARRMIESGALTRDGYLAALQTMNDFDTRGATPAPLDFSQFPYVAGIKTRVLKPVDGHWQVAAGYAAPQALKAE